MNGSLTRYIAVVLTCLVSLICFGSYASADTAVIAEGVAALTGNPAVARERALDDALRRAVEQGVGTMVSSETLSERYRVVHDKVLTRSHGYIKTYRVLGEDQANGLYRVKIQAEVGQEELRRDLQALGLLQLLAEKPRVMVIMEEKLSVSLESNPLFSSNQGWEDIGQSESTLIEGFLASGFRVVDAQTVKKIIDREQALRILAGDDKAAAAAGLQAGAQIVVVGRAMAKNSPTRIGTSKLQSVQATVQARAVRTDDGAVLGARTTRSAKAHIDEMQGGTIALQAAAQQLVKTLGKDILNSWHGEVFGRSREVTLAIAGLGSYQQLMHVSDFLKKGMQGVKAVHQRGFTLGNAELMIDFSGKSSHVAAELAAHSFKGFRLEPLTVTPNRLVLKVVRSSKGGVALNVEGLDSYQDLTMIVGFLQKGVKGVKSVSEQGFTEGTGKLIVDFSGKSSRIATELASHNFEGFWLESVNVTSKRLDFRVVRANASDGLRDE